jgi:hypothetical protein
VKPYGVRSVKALTHGLVAIGLIFSSIPHALADAAPAPTPVLENAPASSPQNHAGRALGRLLTRSSIRLALRSVDTDELRERVEKVSKAKPTAELVGVTQTLLVMMTLAGIEMTAQQIKKNGGNAPSPAQLWEITSGVASETVNSPQIWASILASGGLSLANKPAVALGQIFLHPKLRAAFAPLLARSITSTISFVGWDFGAQLWTEASLLIEDKGDYQVAMNTFGMSKGLLTTAFATKPQSTSVLDQQRARVAKQMLQNMVRVLGASALRQELFYNFVRTDLLTGEFQTMLGSFIAAGAIGTAIFPGAGTLLGLVFGTGGILVSQYLVPQSMKDQITNGWQSLRGQTLQLAMKQNFIALADLTDPSMMTSPKFLADLNQLLRYRQNLRSRWITIEWEQMYLEARGKKATLSKTFPAHFERMKQLYSSELANVRHLESISPQALAQSNVKVLLHREEVRCYTLIQLFDLLAQAAASDPRNDEILQSVEAAESRGFNETDAVLSWIQTTEPSTEASQL